MRPTSPAPICRLFLVLLVAAAPAHAQEVGTTAVLFEPSIEAAGMGGGGVAYFWRDEPNSWSNPALLGTQPGFRYSYGTTQILEEFTDDVYLKSSRFSLGYGGVGVLFAGQPFGSVGEDMKLDYGESQATDVDGNVIATFSAYEEVRSIGVGVSLLDLLVTVLGSDSGIQDVRRRLGISVGHTWKDIVFETDPELPGTFTPGEAEQKDRGAAIRFTPLDEIRDALDEPSDRLRWKVDLAGGYAQLNYDEEGDFFFDDTSIPSNEVYELRRAGGAARMTLAFPSSLQDGIHDFITPTVRLGLNFEKSDYYDDGESFELNIERVGAELVLADAFYLRWGHVKDDFFEVDDTSWGAGLALRYKGLAGVRFDYAHYPFSPFLEGEFVDRYGITVLVDLAGVLLDKPTFGEKF
jgi:hypothetical protein